MRARSLRACFLVWLVSLTIAYYLVPAGRVVTWGAIGLTGAAGIVAGIRLNRPRNPLAWYLMAAAVLCFATGDITYYVLQAIGPEPSFPGWADYFYLAVYVFLAASFLLFIRAQAGAHNRAALIDALVPTVGLGLVTWVFLMAPYIRDDSLTLMQKVVSIGYPLGDVLALAMLLRLLAVPGRRPAAVTVLGLGVGSLLITDVVYGIIRLIDQWHTGGPVEVGWVGFYAALGYAAMMPSMTTMTQPSGTANPDAAPKRGRRVLYLSVASLIAPGVLYLEYLLGNLIDVPVIAGAAACMFLLVVGRVDGLISAQERAGARERALREAGAMLASATTVDDVRKSLLEAVTILMPAGEPYHLQPATWTATDADLTPPPAVVAVRDLPAHLRAQRSDPVLYMPARLPGDPERIGVGILSAPEETLHQVQPAFVALFQQVTEVLERIRLSTEVNHRDSEAYFRTLIQSASDVILIVDDNDSIRYASPSADIVFGRSDLAGRPLTALIADTHHDALGDVLTRARIGPGGRLEGADLTAVCGDRRLVQVECAARDLRADPTVRGMVLTLSDVTERRRLENDLVHQAFHDGLTGLANRVLFRNRLERAFARAGRDGSSVGVLFIDLDDFKEVNDTLGHAVGDQLLVGVGRRIAQVIGAGDTAARMGGDEFAVLIEHGDDPAVTEHVAARIVEALAAPIDLSDGLGGMYVVSGASSVGVATSRGASSATELLRHADLALYLAKGAGKGTWQPYRDELHTAMVERHEMRTALHEAVDDEQFVLRFQPIVDLSDGVPGGVEALVRWQHPTRGLLGPGQFIELAEENGAIVGIGAWVLRESLRRFAGWQATNPDSPLRYISVNVSGRQFRAPGFVARVREALADTGSRPEWLLLEITESLVLRDAEQVWADLGELRALGVRIAIDDFGTGYSSLSYLRQMPVDVLKIDKSFIDDMVGSRQQRALVEAIVTLAGNLDLMVIAEGIEEPEQRAWLIGMGCPYGQGYLFAKPVDADTVQTWLSGSHPIGAPMLTTHARTG